MNLKKSIPLFFIIISIFYIAFSLSIEQNRMIGDIGGWDPGSRAIPLGVGILMLIISVYLLFKESILSSKKTEKLEKSQRNLILLSMLVSLFYIIIFRSAGFIIATNMYLYTLMFFIHKQEFKFKYLPDYSVGLLGVFFFGLILYTLSRYTTRFLFHLGKKNSIEVFTGRLFPAFISIVVVSDVIIIINLLGKKFTKTHNGKIILSSVIFASIVTQTLYIIFKQIFWVDLVNGIVFW